jgi:hypothetical protein
MTVFKTSTIFYRLLCALLYIEQDAEIFPAHCTWKAAEKGFMIAFIMNKLAMVISFEIILKNKNNFLPKIIVKFRCALYLYVHYTR